MEKVSGRRVYHKAKGQKIALGERERRRLAQLGACLVLFLIVLLARGGDRLEPLRRELRSAVQGDVDFRAAFTDLGWAVSAGRPMGETLEELWTDVFLPQGATGLAPGYRGPLYRRAERELSRAMAVPALFTVQREEGSPGDPLAGSGVKRTPEPPEKAQEPAVVHVDYTGPALPENTTMDRYALYLPQTVPPVQGVESSGFGWREHPIEGGEKFHYGVDLAVDTGTAVQAFAAGKVDYIGESDVYGQYLQLDHGNGIKSFYAHCSKLCVQQGQTIAVGEKVAESGATGDVTGPHLHFELKRNGVRLNPDYYITTLLP